MKKRIVFFDFDGVIVDTFSACFAIVDSREYITEADYRKRFEGNVFEAVRKFKDPNTTMESFNEHYVPELMKCEPIKGIGDAIKELASRYTLVIVSSTESEPIDAYLKKVGLRECFSKILGSDVDKSKINKVNMALKAYKVDPSDAVFVTDTLGDIREAEKCSVKSVAVSGGFHHDETLKKGNAIAIVDSGRELVEAVGQYFS